MRQFYIKTQIIKARICEWGEKSNPTIICIHGLGSTNLSFLELAEILKDKYHLLSIDLPGHGETPPFLNESDYEIPNIINWLSKIIDYLRVNEFSLLAHSWGGDIALHYTSTYPERVKKVVLLDGGYYTKSKVYEYYGGSLEEEIEFYEKDFNGYFFSSWDEWLEKEKTFYKTWSPLKELASRDLMREEVQIKFIASGDTARAAIKSMYKNPPSKIYHKLSNNILLLQSTLPEKWHDTRNKLCKIFREETGATVKKIPETTHLLHWDKPLEIAEEIELWFK